MRNCRCGDRQRHGSAFGIDIEGYGEGDIVYEEPVNVIIRNNVLKGNVNNAISNFNGTSVIIEGNIADGTISYGYGTSTTIANNIIKKNSESTGQGIGINGLGVGALEARSDAVIKGNLISGFRQASISAEKAFLSREIKSVIL